ncbi:Protein of uncharacterised function (DUF1315) [Kluyvera cryocrescens]|uniref:Protein of uncharacterized function (DUF1315) n=1 Tax=Kluyvera cryocrescens TaxID=580 RepID=A0A485AA35_KLUCR|nr:Protein of uncharacterised function (DUF1315) [Kluyvera cryocrescens]
MNIEQMIDNMTPEIYQRLVTAVELGKMAGWGGSHRRTERKQPTVGYALAIPS